MTERFPDGFLWGASTSAYQIEGAVREDGRGPSIWDTFSHQPGNILDDDTGDIACDHYHRWPEDVALMRELGIGAYRLSTAWPRICPKAAADQTPSGLEFYDRLIDALMADNIEPWVCLYHWDFPQALEDRGGWQNRDIASWFAEYAAIAVRRLGDRVKHWATFNEPNAASVLGYCEGKHAPGIRGRMTALGAIHVMNLAHGLGAEAMRSERSDLLVGNIYNFHPREPASEREEDENRGGHARRAVEPLLPRSADSTAPIPSRSQAKWRRWCSPATSKSSNKSSIISRSAITRDRGCVTTRTTRSRSGPCPLNQARRSLKWAGKSRPMRSAR